MLAIVKAIKRWSPYLLGKPFTVCTNQKSLKHLVKQRITMSTLAQWSPKILRYDYVIKYKENLENQNADSLSRVIEFHFFLIYFYATCKFMVDITKKLQHNPFYEELNKTGHSQSKDKLLR